MIDASNGSDGVAIGFRAGEMQSQRSVSGTNIVAKKIGRAIVRGEKQIHVAVAIEVGESESAAYARGRKVTAVCGCYILKFSVAEIQKEMRRLRVTHVAANV